MKSSYRYEIQDRVRAQWNGTQDNNSVRVAIETARCYGHIDTVPKDWRWLAEDLMVFYSEHPNTAAACYSYIDGWVDGASKILANAVFSNL